MVATLYPYLLLTPRLPRLFECKRPMTKFIDLIWETYQRLKSRHDVLVQVSLHDIARKLGFLHKLLEA